MRVWFLSVACSFLITFFLQFNLAKLSHLPGVNQNLQSFSISNLLSIIINCIVKKSNPIRLLRLSGNTQPEWTVGFALTSLWGKFAAGTSQYPGTRTLNDFRMYLKNKTSNQFKTQKAHNELRVVPLSPSPWCVTVSLEGLGTTRSLGLETCELFNVSFHYTNSSPSPWWAPDTNYDFLSDQHVRSP